MLSEATRQKIIALTAKYPVRRSALVPSLQAAQEEVGYVSTEAVREIAQIFELSPNEVYEVASFYTMLYEAPVGKYVIQVCTNISCALMGAEHVVEYLAQKLGIKAGGTTPDGKFSLVCVECLGACGGAPMMQVNDTYYENLTREKIDQILAGMK